MKISEISENISHTSKRLRDIEREKKVKPGTDDWFKLWFSLPYLKEAKENITNEDRHPNDRPYGPETKPTMPAGTVRVDVSDVYDWYKLGMHISDLKGLGKHDFGKGPPNTIFSFGSEEQEHEYIKDLKKTGLTTTDIDPKDPKQPKNMPRQKTDPTYNVENVAHDFANESNVFTNARMNAIKAGKKEFSVNGKTYKVTGDIKDELEAGTNEARSFAPQQTPMQDLVNSYLFFTSFGQMGASDSAKSPDSAEKIKEVTRILSQSHKNLQNLDKQTLEKNKNKILTHIHDMMNYAIAHFKEHLTPDNFQAKRKQINDILTKYNSLAATNENFADGKNPGRKGLAKRMGVDTKASVSSLRKTAKNSTGEKQRIAHWLANMKAGRDK